jgi:hypothetical protein
VADALFVMGLLLPPAVVVVSFALLAVPERQDVRAARRTDAHAH